MTWKFWDWDDAVAFALVLILLATVLIVALTYGFVLAYNSTFVGQRYDVTVTAQAVEHSTRFGEHTNLWATIYGEEQIVYNFYGFHDFELGEAYRIVFQNAYAVFGFEVWGVVEEIEKVSE